MIASQILHSRANFHIELFSALKHKTAVLKKQLVTIAEFQIDPILQLQKAALAGALRPNCEQEQGSKREGVQTDPSRASDVPLGNDACGAPLRN